MKPGHINSYTKKDSLKCFSLSSMFIKRHNFVTDYSTSIWSFNWHSFLVSLYKSSLVVCLLCLYHYLLRKTFGILLWKIKNITTNFTNPYFKYAMFWTCFFSTFSSFNDEKTKLLRLHKGNHNSWQWWY